MEECIFTFKFYTFNVKFYESDEKKLLTKPSQLKVRRDFKLSQ